MWCSVNYLIIALQCNLEILLLKVLVSSTSKLSCNFR